MMKNLLFVLVFSLLLGIAFAGNPVAVNPDVPTDFGVELTVYPNPSTGIITLRIENPEGKAMQIRVLNLIGQVVAERHSDSFFEETLNLTRYPKGVYFVQVQVDTRKISKRIILQ